MSILAVDLGGTRVKVGRVAGAEVLDERVLEGRSELGFAQVLPRLGGVLREMRDDAVTGVAIGLPTLVDVRTGRVLAEMRGKYDGVMGVDLGAWCLGELGLPLRVENDAHAALVGEWRYGAGRGCGDLVMVTLGTGIGTSVVIGGRCLRGAHATAGNLGGHMVMVPGGAECVCGAAGCVEAEQGRAAIERAARADAGFGGSALARVELIDYAAVFAWAETDAVARRVRDRSLGIWGAMVVGLIHQFDCSRVVVGGGILRSAGVIVPALREAAGRACTPAGRVEVVAGELGDRAALVGLSSLVEDPPEYL